jgi:hypothetical protein
MTESERIQKNVKRMDRLQDAYGGRGPEYINMILASRLESLTKCLIALTLLLAILTLASVVLICIQIRS